jgi:hypothetical protein
VEAAAVCYGGRAVSRNSIAHLAGRLLRALLVLLLSVLAAEAVVRGAASRVPGIRLLAEPLGTRRREPQTFGEFRRAYGDHLVPFRDLHGFRCNSLGFHDVEFERARSPGTLRVVALGDSFTFCGSAYPRCYLTLAEALLAAAAGGGRPAPVEIDNLGVPASGIADYRLVYALLGRELAPDLVLVTVYLGNDPLDFADPARFGRVRRPSRSWLVTFLRRSAALAAERWRARDGELPAPTSLAALRTSLVSAPSAVEDDRPVFSDEAFAGIQSVELAVLARPGATLAAPDWDAFLAGLGDLVDVVERDRVRVVLALAPSRLQIYPAELARVAARDGAPLADVDADLPQRRLAAFAAGRGLPLVDLTPALRDAAAAGEVLYQRNDTHWNARGNAVAGIELARRLLDLRLVPSAASR